MLSALHSRQHHSQFTMEEKFMLDHIPLLHLYPWLWCLCVCLHLTLHGMKVHRGWAPTVAVRIRSQ